MKKPNDLNDLNEFLFLVGSGISYLSPANLPLGKGLTEFVLEESCGKEIADVILNTWNKSKDIIYNYDNSLVFPCPRLETICGCIYELDNIFNRKSILKGFHSYSEIPPNKNHQILAALLKNGGNIITTNFDLGIENAFVQNHGTISAFETNNVCGYKTNLGTSIFHLHGCSNNTIDKLGTTISKVKSGFSEDAKKVLIKLINNAKQVIVLGYGAVDTFDIIPLFQDERIKGKHIHYVQHCTKPQVSQKSKVPFYWYRMKSNFISDNFEEYNTTKFLQDFASKNGISLSVENQIVYNPYDWKEKFKTAWDYQYSEEERLINFLAIRYQLGFNPGIVQPIYPNIIEKIEYISKKPIYNHPRIKDYFAMALKDFDIPKDKTFSKNKNIVKSKINFIDKEHLVCLRDECDYYIEKYRDLSLGITPKDMDRINFIYDVLVDYSTYDYSKVQYISYIITCLKYKALFGARFKNENPTEPCKNELLLSLEISHFEGVITALLHYIKATVVYNRLNFIKNDKRLKLAVDTAYKLSNKTGCYFYKVIINDYLKENEICF